MCVCKNLASNLNTEVNFKNSCISCVSRLHHLQQKLILIIYPNEWGTKQIWSDRSRFYTHLGAHVHTHKLCTLGPELLMAGSASLTFTLGRDFVCHLIQLFIWSLSATFPLSGHSAFVNKSPLVTRIWSRSSEAGLTVIRRPSLGKTLPLSFHWPCS